MNRITAALGLATLLSACARPELAVPMGSAADVAAEADRQRAAVIQDRLDRSQRLLDVGFPLQAANADMCGAHVAAGHGFRMWNIDSLPADKVMRRVARDLMGLDARYRVSAVATGGPADLAGLKRGDLLLNIAEKPVPTGRKAEAETEDAIKAAAGNGRFNLEVERDGQPLRVSITPVRVCDYDIHYKNDDVVNAWTDGKDIYVTRGIMDFTQNDGELALVISHELGHDIMDHVGKRNRNAAMAGGLVAALELAAMIATGVPYENAGQATQAAAEMGAKAWSREFEAEADYVGLYAFVRAGWPAEGAANFWRRMATVDSAAIDIGKSHPTTPDRFVLLTRTSDEIATKQAAGQPMLPDRLAGEAAAEPADRAQGARARRARGPGPFMAH